MPCRNHWHPYSILKESVVRDNHSMSFVEQNCIIPSPNLMGSKALRGNPIAVFTRLALAEGYEAEAFSDNEIELSLPGEWCDHTLSLIWNPKTERLQGFLMFYNKAPMGRHDDIFKLMSLINESLTAGHLEFSTKQKSLIFRHTVSLNGGASLSIEQAMDFVACAINAAEQAYPACQYMIWAGKSPEEALNNAHMDVSLYP